MAQAEWSAPAHQQPGPNPQWRTPEGGVDPITRQLVAESRVWVSLVAWPMIIAGALYCLTIVGAIVGWLPLWIGLSLRKSAKAASQLEATGETVALHEYLRGLKTYMTVMGAITLLSILAAAVMVIMALAGGLSLATMDLGGPP